MKVLTCFDVPEHCFPTAGHPWSMDPGHQDVADRNLLNRHVRYYGDDIAVVIAEDEVSAMQGVRALKVSVLACRVQAAASVHSAAAIRAVMVTDVIILDVFNTLGMPTSTTVSLVFELLGDDFDQKMMAMIEDEYTKKPNKAKVVSLTERLKPLFKAADPLDIR